METECDLGLKFVENAVCDVATGAVAELEDLLKTESMTKWGRIVLEISDRDLAILSMGMTERGRHFLLAGLADERLPKVAEMTYLLESDKNDDAEIVAQMIIENWEMEKKVPKVISIYGIDGFYATIATQRETGLQKDIFIECEAVKRFRDI